MGVVTKENIFTLVWKLEGQNISASRHRYDFDRDCSQILAFVSNFGDFHILSKHQLYQLIRDYLAEDQITWLKMCLINSLSYA